MPMHNAPLNSVLRDYKCPAHKKVKCGVVDWYNSVIRLQSSNRKEIGDLAKEIVTAWASYTDESCGIIAETDDGVRHNSLAPVCRKVGKDYIFDLILRNNLTNEQYPDGIFHAHPEYHNIKKEGIGLIEAMGLFILPGRLKKQLAMIAEILCGKVEYKPEELENPENYLYAHRNMIKELMVFEKPKDQIEAEQRVEQKVNEICKNILFNTAVFKSDMSGIQGFNRFLQSVGIIQ